MTRVTNSLHNEDPLDFYPLKGWVSMVIARLASSMRVRDTAKSEQLLKLARSKIEKLAGRPRNLVMSYITRHLGVDFLQRQFDRELSGWFCQINLVGIGCVRKMFSNTQNAYLSAPPPRARIPAIRLIWSSTSEFPVNLS